MGAVGQDGTEARTMAVDLDTEAALARALLDEIIRVRGGGHPEALLAQSVRNQVDALAAPGEGDDPGADLDRLLDLCAEADERRLRALAGIGMGFHAAADRAY